MTEQQKQDIYSFLREYMIKHHKDITIRTTYKDFLKLFKDWYKKVKHLDHLNDRQFWMTLIHMKIDGITNGPRVRSGNTKIINICKLNESLKRLEKEERPSKLEGTVVNELEDRETIKKQKNKERQRQRYQEKKQEKQELIHLNYMNFD